jgi:RNA polymerase sigma-54 factor
MPFDAGMRQRQRQAQTQTMAPQMRQSLNMLAMSLPELRDELYREMSNNPVIDDIEQTLERETISDRERKSDEEVRSRESDYPEDDSDENAAYSRDADALERRQRFFDSQTKEETLEEHLLAQLSTSDMTDAERAIAEMVIGDLDDSGYFAGAVPDLVMVSGEPEETVRSAMRKVMLLDPPGCGATSLEECLLAQTDKLDSSPYQQEVRELLEHGRLKDVAEGRTEKVEEDLGTSEERLPDVLAALRSLDPRPGRAFSRSGRSVAYVNPEVHAVKADGRWTARVDARSLPEIRVSEKYLKMLHDPSVDAATKEYIRGKVEAVRAFKDAIEHREETVTKIAQAIFDAQPGFFDRGLKGLRPMTMQEIADKVGVHHTTVSRTVRDKYVSTPRGVVELRRFFTSGVASGSGEAVSQESVMAALKATVEAEDASNPLSDDRIAAELKKAGYVVARRTVAKYRAKMGIPGASARRS